MIRTTRHLLLLAALVFAGAPAVAQPVYKCVADNGKVTYSQNPCYGEQWHRLGEKPAQPRRSPETASPANAPDSTDKAAGPRPAAAAPQAAASIAPAAAGAAASTTATRP